MVRLIQGDSHPDGPGYRALHVPSEIEGTHAGVEQPLPRGSHVEVEALTLPRSFTIAAWVWPTLIGPGERGLLGHASEIESGVAITLDGEGRLAGEEVAQTTICATSCLSHNGYDNDVSRITANVLDRFLADG